jgi:hypothetical protein
MKTMKSVFALLAITALLFSFGTVQPAMGYQINLAWLLGDNIDPLVFSVGPFIPGDISHPGDIHFGDIQPFFQLTVTDNVPADPDTLYLWIRMETGAGEPIFTVRSNDPVDVVQNLLESHNNYQLGQNPAINLINFRAEDVMGYLDGGNIREGFYHLIVALSAETEWSNVNYNNSDIASLGILVRNPSQVRLEMPDDGASTPTNPVFMWAFPRQFGVTFNLEVVKGEPGDDPWTAMEFANPSNIYALVDVPVPEWLAGGELTAYIYTGTGQERTLDQGTYFWRVTANAPGVFPTDFHSIASQVYTFNYNPPQLGGGGGGGGWLPGGAAGGEYNPPPLPPEIFQILRQILPEALYRSLMAQLGNLEGWNLGEIKIGDRVVTLQELVNFLLAGNRTIVLAALSQ